MPHDRPHVSYYNSGYGLMAWVKRRHARRWLWCVYEHERPKILRCGAARTEQTAMFKARVFIDQQLRRKVKPGSALDRVLIHEELERLL